MEYFYVILLVALVCASILIAFGMGYKAGSKIDRAYSAEEKKGATLLENIKDIVSEITAKKQADPDDIDTVETVDGKQKEIRKFF